MKGALDLLTNRKPVAKSSRLAFVRLHAKTKSKASMASVKKLMKLAQASGQTVTGVMIGADGSVSVTTGEAKKASAAPANPWDTELE